MTFHNMRFSYHSKTSAKIKGKKNHRKLNFTFYDANSRHHSTTPQQNPYVHTNPRRLSTLSALKTPLALLSTIVCMITFIMLSI